MSQTSSPPAELAPEVPAPKSPAVAAVRGDNKGDNDDVTEDPAPMDSPNPRAEEGEASESDDAPLPNEKPPGGGGGPPLPAETVPSAGPPLPREPVPQQEDDGWDCQWEPNAQAWYFVNRFTGKSQWDNPRMAVAPTAAEPPSTNTTTTATVTAPLPPSSELPAAGGYNPAIHGDYDPNAWYAQGTPTEDAGGVEAEGEEAVAAAAAAGLDPYAATARFNRFTGQFQDEGTGPWRHSDDANSRRQLNAFFDVDAAANSHDGRSLKAERSNKKPSKTEVKAFKEKRRARKEEKRRAWLRD